MKKFLSLVLALAMLISIGVVMATAAGEDFTLKVQADKAEVSPGDEVTFTFTLAGSSKYDAINFEVKADSGLTYVTGSASYGTGFGTGESSEVFVMFDKNTSSGDFYQFSAIGKDISAGKLFSARFKVDSKAAAGAKLNVTASGDKTSSTPAKNFILSSGSKDYTCAITGATVTVKSASTGVNVSGAVQSYTVGSMTGSEKVTVSLMKGSTTVATQSVTTSYSFTNVAAGTYTVKVEKLNHVTREYTVTVASSNVTQDVKICPIGDVNADGDVKVADYALVLAHVKGTKLITDPYALACADVNKDGDIKVADYALVLAHVKGTKLLF